MNYSTFKHFPQVISSLADTSSTSRFALGRNLALASIVTVALDALNDANRRSELEYSIDSLTDGNIDENNGNVVAVCTCIDALIKHARYGNTPSVLRRLPQCARMAFALLGSSRWPVRTAAQHLLTAIAYRIFARRDVGSEGAGGLGVLTFAQVICIAEKF